MHSDVGTAKQCIYVLIVWAQITESLSSRISVCSSVFTSWCTQRKSVLSEGHMEDREGCYMPPQ